MAKAKKTKSGNWRVLVYTGTVDGKRKYRSITAPTKSEAELRAINAQMQKRPSRSLTLRRAYELYIESKNAVLSASTLREYERILKTSKCPLMNRKIDEITKNDIQKEVNELSKRLSPKSVRNHYGLLTAVMSTYREDFKFKVTLPQKIKSKVYVPEDYEIEYIKNELIAQKSWLLLPFMLGHQLGLRESEIVALTYGSFDRRKKLCNVSNAIVAGRNGQTMKAPKSDAGYRFIPVSDEVLDLIGTGRPKDRIVPKAAYCISTSWKRFMEKTDITYFSFHKLRYYFCSKALLKGIPKSYVVYFMGHSNDQMVNRVYEYLFPSAIENYAQMLVSDFQKNATLNATFFSETRLK